MDGFFNIWKPAGITSAGVVSVMRRLTGEKRIGHAGTLDPEAAGVLPIMAGKATRLFDFLVDKQKEYRAVIAFGTATDTQDATGNVIAEGEGWPDETLLLQQAQRLIGDIRQRPSMYSAIKVGGQPLYQRARKGETAEVPERIVHVDAITVEQALPDHAWQLLIRCGKGTYIRTLCHDLGILCGCPAHMRSLLRTQSGVFTLETALPLEEARQLASEGRLGERLLPLDVALGHLFRTELQSEARKLAENGCAIPLGLAAGPVPEEGIATAVYLEDAFCGIAFREENVLKWRAMLGPCAARKEESV